MNESVPEPEPRSSDRVAGRDLRQVEHVADAGERRERVGRHGVEPLGRIAEPLGERAAGLEVEVAAGFAGDRAIHLAHVVAQLRRVDDGR